jgi:[ribosomal protein S5]-alanine N-acetyltransferase
MQTIFFEVRGDPEAMAFWDWPADANPAETCAVIERLLADVASAEALFWTMRLSSDGSFVGLCDLSEIQASKSAEIGLLLVRRFWGIGLGGEAVAWVLQQAKAMGLKTVCARIHGANHRSARLLERAGFKLEGTAPGIEIRPGVFRDCKRFEIML